MKLCIGQAPLLPVCCVATTAFLISPALAQVNGPGPSPANLFAIVLYLPGDEDGTAGFAGSIGGVAGQTTQLNFNDGRWGLDFTFEAFSGSELNISGGLQAEADIDLSGVVNFLDVTPFIQILLPN